MNRNMPSKGGNPIKHNRSVAMAKVLVNDCKEALARPNVPPHLRSILKSYESTYREAGRKKNFSGWVLAG